MAENKTSTSDLAGLVGAGPHDERDSEEAFRGMDVAVPAAQAGEDVVGDPDDPLVLKLEELLPDEGGEIVLSALGDDPLNVVAAPSVIDSGTAASHVTASGIDVAGYSYYAFESGITLYLAPDLSVSLVPEVA